MFFFDDNSSVILYGVDYSAIELFLCIVFFFCILYALVFTGFFFRLKTFLHYLYFIELLKLLVCCAYIILFCIYKNIVLLIIVLVLLAVAATESAIGLALLINYHKVSFSKNLTVDHLSYLRN